MSLKQTSCVNTQVNGKKARLFFSVHGRAERFRCFKVLGCCTLFDQDLGDPRG